MEALDKEKVVSVFLRDDRHPPVTSSGVHAHTRMSGERLPSKIHNTNPFEAAPEPNIVTHITELTSHFPWQQKAGRERERRPGQRGKQPFKAIQPFNIPDGRGCGGSVAVAAIKYGTLNFHRGAEVGVIPATVGPQPPCASWVENKRERGAGMDERPCEAPGSLSSGPTE